MRKVIDLSAEIYDGAPTMPMDPKCSVTPHCSLDTLGYNLARLTVSTHQGTHMDVPFHFFNDGLTIDKLDLNRCVVEAVKADLTYKKPKEPITPDDLAPYEAHIHAGRALLMSTGWDKVFPRKEFFSDFPYLTAEAADWLAELHAPLIGMDMPTPNGQSWKYVHERLLGASVLILEGLTNMGTLGSDPFLFITLPLKLRDRDGSPVRAVALVETDE